MLDCTFNTPWLLKPFALGANLIIHSLTKWIGGHGIAIAGAVVDGGNFDWGQNDKFPSIAGPHYAMDSINFYEEFGPRPQPNIHIYEESGPQPRPTIHFYE